MKAMPMWVIYENPADYRGRFVVRRWEVMTDAPRPCEVTADEKSLFEARMKGIPHWAVRLDRNKFDDPCIVEMWL